MAAYGGAMLTLEQWAFRAQWAEALLSGRYEQAKGVLQSPDGRMCCLGVSCDLIDHDKWGEVMTDAPPEGDVKDYHAKGYAWGEYRGLNTFTLPPDGLLEEKAGLSHFHIRELAARNDAGATFVEIAHAVITGDIAKLGDMYPERE